jgi:23S rRNA (cytosine1962-C5)-methyltransferase
LKSIILKPGREKSVIRRHPWIFSGAIDKVIGEPSVGETVQVKDSKQNPLAVAAFSPHSSIRARIWDWNPDAKINTDFFKNKLDDAIKIRKYALDKNLNSTRLFYAESDGIPGLIVDRYSDWLVLQFLTTGVEFWREILIQLVREICHIQNVYERSDVEIRELEGLPLRTGSLCGEEPPDEIEIIENGFKFLVDIKHGQKTGFYLDQHENRARIQDYAKDRSVLDCFCHTGGFSIYAAAAGARNISCIDSSRNALEMAKRNFLLNNHPIDLIDWVEGDVFEELRKMRDHNKKFDLIVLDPPKFAPTSSQVHKAARGYKDINLLALKLLNPHGILFTFSCSGGITMDLFQKIIADAALDAGVYLRIIEKLHQSADHTIAINFPESEYLKGLICQI